MAGGTESEFAIEAEINLLTGGINLGTLTTHEPGWEKASTRTEEEKCCRLGC